MNTHIYIYIYIYIHIYLHHVHTYINVCQCDNLILATARMQIAAREIVLWTTPSEPPKALQASECSELLDPMRASCLILAQHQPGKFRVLRFGPK